MQEVVQGTIKQYGTKCIDKITQDNTLLCLNESSESDSEEDFQDGISLLRRTRRDYGLFLIKRH